MPEPVTTATMPAGPFAMEKAAATAAVLAARDEILDLSHRIHANPEPAFEEVQAATWVAAAIAGHGYAVEHPVGPFENVAGGLRDLREPVSHTDVLRSLAGEDERETRPRLHFLVHWETNALQTAPGARQSPTEQNSRG